MVNRRKALSLLLAICFLVTLFPFQAMAYVNTDNIGTAAVKNATGNWVGGETFDLDIHVGAFRLIGYWDVIHSQTKDKLGKAPVLNLDEASAKVVGMTPGCYTLINPNTLEAWVEAFNGNQDFVKSVVEREQHFLKRDSDGQTFSRYWLRDIAYASGAMIEPDETNKIINAAISNYPTALFDEGIEDKTFVAGESSSIGIYGESWVLYRQEGGYPGLTWELQIDGEKVAGETIKAMRTTKFKPVPYTFCCEGNYRLTLIVTDGVGRTTKTEKTVTVGEGIIEENRVDDRDAEIKLTAVNQTGKEKRPDFTAKWTDIVTADFTPRSAPDLGECYRLKTWELQSAEITYPKKSKNFTFGHPVPPEGTITIPMRVDRDRNTATVSFEEDWSLNGAFIYDRIAKKMVEGPTKYPITVKYKMLWEYRKGRLVCDENGCKCVNMNDYEKIETYTTTAQLLVNGTGVDSKAQ